MRSDAPTPAEISAAVEGTGWRYVLGGLVSTVRVGSLEQAVRVVAAAVETCGPDADAHLLAVPRATVVELELQSLEESRVSGRDVELARAISAALDALGMETGPAGRARTVQRLEIAVDALDIPRIRPFWRAVLGYVAEPGCDGPEDPLVDPTRQGPAVWFQQMSKPRTQRNRIHLDVSVPHDEAEARVAAALAAGGTLVSDARARAFWVLADAEGNEVCVCTWQDRG